MCTCSKCGHVDEGIERVRQVRDMYHGRSMTMQVELNEMAAVLRQYRDGRDMADADLCATRLVRENDELSCERWAGEELEQPAQRACEHCTHCEPAENVDDYGCTCPVLRQVFPGCHTSLGIPGAISCMQIRATVMHSWCSHWQPKEPAHA